MKTDPLATEIRRLSEIVTRMTPPIPAIPAIPPLPQYTGDHDLLVKLDTKVEGIMIDVKKLTDKEETHVAKIDYNDHIVATNKIHDDFEVRIRSNEVSITRILTWGTSMIFVLSLVEFAVLKIFK